MSDERLPAPDRDPFARIHGHGDARRQGELWKAQARAVWEDRLVRRVLKHFGLAAAARQVLRRAQEAGGGRLLTLPAFRAWAGDFPAALAASTVSRKQVADVLLSTLLGPNPRRGRPAWEKCPLVRAFDEARVRAGDSPFPAAAAVRAPAAGVLVVHEITRLPEGRAGVGPDVFLARRRAGAAAYLAVEPLPQYLAGLGWRPAPADEEGE